MAGTDIHVYLYGRKWAVRRNGYRTPLSVHEERKEAVKVARALAAKDGSHVVVYDVGGKALPLDALDDTP